MVIVSGVVLHRFALTDLALLRYAVVRLIDDGYLRLQDLPLAFGYNERCYFRWKGQLERDGIAGLEDRKKGGSPWKMGPLEDAVRALFAQGLSGVAIASRLTVSEHAVRYTLNRLGLKRPEPEQILLGSEPESSLQESVITIELETTLESDEEIETIALPEESSEETECQLIELSAPAHIEIAASRLLAERIDDPLNRVLDRMLARQGKLSDALPWFTSGVSIPYAGVLLAIPLIVMSGILETFDTHYTEQKRKSAFYGLRTTVMSLLFMALLRVKHPENLKENDPTSLGRVLGLDRGPEVKTLRRKLAELATYKKGAVVMRAMALRELKANEALSGFLYIDGHVREYHGNGSLSKGYSTRRRLGIKSATDTYVNDARGEPLFLVTSELNEGLTQVLEDIVDEVKALIGEEQRFTMIFDRGGWSPELFAKLFGLGVDVLTYRKGNVKEALEPKERVKKERKPRFRKKIDIPWQPLYAHDSFEQQQQAIEGVEYKYTLLERSVRMGKLTYSLKGQEQEKLPFWMREVTRLCDDNEKLTQVMTTRQDISAVTVLYRMFNRWRQENFFPYSIEDSMRQEYAIDALVEYATEDVSEDATRPNPERRTLERKLSQLNAEFNKRSANYSRRLMDNPTGNEPTVADFKMANQALGQELEALESKRVAMKIQIAALPERISAEGLEYLAFERKGVTDTIKMCAYRLETGLVRLLGDAYARTEDDGRKLIVAALRSPADIQPVGDELRVTLGRQSSPHRDRALSILCARLNTYNTLFPGSHLRLHFATSTAQD